MIDILAVASMIAAIAVIIIQYNFFKKQKRKIQKYPYFKLRDEIISQIVKTEDFERYEPIYSLVNSTVNLIKYFNFSFYSDALGRYLNTLVEKVAESNFEYTEEALRHLEPRKFSPEAQKLGVLLVKSARQNSWLLWLATTKIGFEFFVTSKLFTTVLRFIINNWQSNKYQPQYDVVKGYSYLSHKLAI